MSSLIVEVVKVEKVIPHPDPETVSLEVAFCKGWQLVVRKGALKEGDLCIYFPIDSLLTIVVGDLIGVTKYLSNGRVKPAKMRGVPSYGILWPVSEAKAKLQEYFAKTSPEVPWDRISKSIIPNFDLGEDVSAFYGVGKWEPPLKLNAQDEEVPHPLLFKYTDIENYRNFPNILEEGEEVIITEKVHGCSSRQALIEGTFMAGGHNARMKENPMNEHWFCFDEDSKRLLRSLESRGPAILYGEVFGCVQDLKYGMGRGERVFNAFDLSINGRYLDYDEFSALCIKYGVFQVPLLYRGPWSFKVLDQFRDKDSTIPSAKNMMEGVVIRPVKERTHLCIGRVVLKYVWDRYLNRHGGTEFH